ncbi:uncharacterized protein TrAFT101_003262 [Trichoderma asperellum]|uniref:uncharacterized protein n=1 Tax=Trichoderma asperellum TaxID=101201 RepID=UPI003332F66C|nr:hypothetical protein TrAFT101_003262 [Trichoderma asperellum]
MLSNKRYFPPPRTNAACQHCQDLNLSLPTIDGILGIPLGLLQTSAASGCPYCALLIKALELPGLEPPNNEDLFGVTLFSGVDSTNAEPFPLIVRLQTEYRNFAEIELYVDADSSYRLPAIGRARNIEANGLSDQCVALMNSWMKECLSQHKMCHQPQSSMILPDRVLDVRPGKNPRLILNQSAETGVYAALSHSWGGQVALQLRQKNLEDLRRDISLQGFPMTFRHAIEVCRALAIPFLWIDSLCIIQDSATDWAVQGSKMDAVYSNCQVVIAADGAHNSEKGFLEDPWRQIPVLKLVCPRPASDGGTPKANKDEPQSKFVDVYARKKGTGNMDVFMHHSRASNYRSNLSSRGWILQESVLASRILHFTAEEITWECRSVSRCECRVNPHIFTHEMPMKYNLTRELDHKEHWAKLVQEFTCRDLTYPSDRLPAMAGIASHMHSRNPSIEFHAGLWSDSFASSLLWFCLDRGMNLHGGKRKSRRVQPESAPTWSWASVTGRIMFSPSQSTLGALKNLHVNCSPAGPNMYGSVSSATLMATVDTFRGIIIAHKDHRDAFQLQLISDDGIHRSNLIPDGEIFPDILGDSTEMCVGDEVILMDPVGHDDKYLILKPSSHGPSTYRRLGLYMTSPLRGLWPARHETITLI